MIDEPDFSLDADTAGTAGEAAAAPAPAPKVVIEYRSRGLPPALVAPLLIVLAVLAIQLYRHETPIRRFRPARLVVVERPPAAPVAAESPRATPPPKPDPPPAGAEATAAVAETSSADEPAPNEETSRPAPAEPDPAPAEPEPAATPAKPPRVLDPPALAANLAPEPTPHEDLPRVSREQVLADIEQEAERKEAEIQRIEALKPQLRVLHLAEIMRKAQANRVPFHEALRKALRGPKAAQGKTIESLCEEFGRTANADLKSYFNRRLKTSYAHLSKRAKIEMMRASGLPEPMILDYISNDYHRKIGERGGPRNEDEVLIMAARVLLTMPPVTSRRAAPAPAGGPSRPTSNTRGPR